MKIIENLFVGRNILDLVIAAALIFSLIRSFLKGVVREIFSLLALGLGIISARQMFPQVAKILEGDACADSPWITRGVAFVLVFLAVYIIISILGFMVRTMIRSVELSWLDHLGGAILGLLKGGFLLCLLIAVLVMILPPDSQIIKTSQLAHFFFQEAAFLMKFAPEEINLKFREKIERFQNPEAPLNKKKTHRTPSLKSKKRKPAAPASFLLFSESAKEWRLLSGFSDAGYSRPFSADNRRKPLVGSETVAGEAFGFWI
ncbi:MAG: CvpA family protein [bacterium]|nr:CvpA family protein [bacterium]